MTSVWKRDCMILSLIAASGLIAGVALLCVNNIWAKAFGIEFIWIFLMFAPCAAWRMINRPGRE